MINNRQNGRRRGRGGQRPGGNGNPGRPDNGSRIDNRARGNASQLHEKYRALAAEAQRQGDRVNTEYYLQFADHYFRVLSENRPRNDDQQRVRRDEFDDEFGTDGEDYGNEGEPVRADQYQPQERPRYDDRPRQDDRSRQEERPRQDEKPRQDDRPRRDDRPRQEERARQDDRPRQEERPRQDARPRDDFRDNAPREQGGQRDDRRPRNANGNGYARPVAESAPESVEVAVLAPDPATEMASTPGGADMEPAAPRRRGRPRRERPEDAVPAVEAESGLDADRLPPSLSISASAEPDAAADPAISDGKPRRRRVAASVDAPPAS